MCAARASAEAAGQYQGLFGYFWQLPPHASPQTSLFELGQQHLTTGSQLGRVGDLVVGVLVGVELGVDVGNLVVPGASGAGVGATGKVAPATSTVSKLAPPQDNGKNLPGLTYVT